MLFRIWNDEYIWMAHIGTAEWKINAKIITVKRHHAAVKQESLKNPIMLNWLERCTSIRWRSGFESRQARYFSGGFLVSQLHFNVFASMASTADYNGRSWYNKILIMVFESSLHQVLRKEKKGKSYFVLVSCNASLKESPTLQPEWIPNQLLLCHWF